ncbi:MAG: peptidylprolyl isomerase [Tepidisphaeraceae bacterium]
MRVPPNRRARSAGRFCLEQLESRCLLSATLLSAVPTQSVAPSGTATVNLSTYFDDPTIPAGDSVVNMVTNLPAPYNSIPLELTNAATPDTVANFLHYITSGEFANTIFHRSVPGFIIQGGGYSNTGAMVSSFGAINGESSTATLTNTTGTIAMALSTGPDSATSEWFFNLDNNNGTTSNPNLDNSSDGGPFTAFGIVIYNGLSTIDDIADLPTVNDEANGAWSNLPVQNYSGENGATVASVPTSDYVTINPVIVPGGITYGAVSANTSLVTTSIVNGVLTLTPVAGVTSGSTTVTVTATDLGGGTAQSTFTVNLTPLALTTPATAVSVNSGTNYTIDWTGGNSTDTVQLWAEGGPNNAWTELSTGVPETDGSFTWNTTGVDHGWYYFQAWDIPAGGTAYAVQSPNYLHIEDTGAAAPNISLSNPVLAGEAVAQGGSYTINFTATDGTGDTNPIFVQLWVYSGNTGQWTELPSANYLPASQGSYVWNTTGVAPGWYSFAAHATDGDQWSYAASPGWLNVTVTEPTIAFTTPTSGQSAVAGGTFNLNWNITGLSTSDAATSTVQIWAQYLNNGTPVWTEIAASVNASTGTYTWTVPTTPGAGTFYAFSLWLNDGDEWWAQASANWLQVT